MPGQFPEVHGRRREECLDQDVLTPAPLSAVHSVPNLGVRHHELNELLAEPQARTCSWCGEVLCHLVE